MSHNLQCASFLDHRSEIKSLNLDARRTAADIKKAVMATTKKSARSWLGSSAFFSGFKLQ